MESIPVSGVQSAVTIPEEEQENTAEEQETTAPPTPKLVKVRKPRTKKTTAPTIMVPDIDDKFWAGLLRTQREAERATKLQRISEFSLI